ncbi:hypothetical protein EJB05_06905, partial [Eragrostis curvula]
MCAGDDATARVRLALIRPYWVDTLHDMFDSTKKGPMGLKITVTVSGFEDAGFHFSIDAAEHLQRKAADICPRVQCIGYKFKNEEIMGTVTQARLFPARINV